MEAVIAIPVFLMLLLVLIDASAYLYYATSLDAGSQQIARLVESTPKPQGSEGISGEQAKTLMVKACPVFADTSRGQELTVSVSSDSGTTHTYTHHLPDTLASGMKTDRASAYETYETEIQCKYRYKPSGMLGKLLADSDGMITVSRNFSVRRSADVAREADIW